MRKKITFLFSIFIIGLILVACESSESTAEPVNPHIRGLITSLNSHDDGTIGIMVEGALETDTQYDKAMIGINSDTRVLINDSQGIRSGEIKDIKENQKVEVFFVGPINTSYPVQASAGKIIIYP